MSLRNRTLFTVGGFSLLLVIALIIAAQAILIDGFEQLEQQNAEENVQRVQNTINDEINTLLTTNADWSNWTDSYEFLQDGNESYIEDNLSDDSFGNLNANMMIFITNDAEIVFSKAFDLEVWEEIPLPEGLDIYLTTGSPLVHHADESSFFGGIVQLPQGPIIITSRPILTNEGEGPIHGALIFGRFLDEQKVQAISSSLKLDFTLNPLSESFDDTDSLAITELEQNEPFVQTLDNNLMAGYGFIKDIESQPILLLKVMMNRDIVAQGQKTFTFFAISLVIIALVGGILTTILLDRTVLSRIANLQTEVSQISTSGDLSYRVKSEGQDELSGLSTKLNEMLEALARSQQAQRESDERLRTVVNNAPVLLWSSKPSGELILLDGAELQHLKLDASGLIGTSLPEWIDQVPMTTQDFQQTLNGELMSTTARVAEQLFTAQYVPLKNSDGTVASVVGIATNITNQATAEESLKEANLSLDMKNRALERAHELLRSTVEQLNETMQRGGSLDELSDSVQFIQKEFEQLQN